MKVFLQRSLLIVSKADYLNTEQLFINLGGEEKSWEFN